MMIEEERLIKLYEMIKKGRFKSKKWVVKIDDDNHVIVGDGTYQIFGYTVVEDGIYEIEIYDIGKWNRFWLNDGP